METKGVVIHFKSWPQLAKMCVATLTTEEKLIVSIRMAKANSERNQADGNFN